jgi:hypothetical protein
MVVGAFIAVLEIFPNPEFVDKHAHFLNTYPGRAILYMAIALISSDSVGVADQHKWYVYLTWLTAATIASVSLFYFVLGFVDMYWKPLPVSKSMTLKAKSGIKVLNSDSRDPIGVNKTESGWTVTNGDDDNDDMKSIQMQRTPYGDPFDQESVDQKSISQFGWKRDSQPSIKSKGLPAPLMMESKAGSTYSLDMSGPSYTSHHLNGSSDSSQYWIKTPDLSPPGNLLRKVQHNRSRMDDTHSRIPRRPTNPFRGVRYTQEASSSRDDLLPVPVLGYSPNQHSANSSSSSQHAYAQGQSPLGQSGWTLDEEYRKRLGQQAKRQPSSNKHKRVFVPGIGSFDLSSGSESEADDVISDHQDSDNDSVYSVDSDVDVGRTETQGPARLGRKLTRKETRTYKAKLNRGMQRALSQRKGPQI